MNEVFLLFRDVLQGQVDRPTADRDQVAALVDEAAEQLTTGSHEIPARTARNLARTAMALYTMYADELVAFRRLLGLYLVIMADGDVTDLAALLRDHVPALEAPLRSTLTDVIRDLALHGSKGLRSEVLALAKASAVCLAWWDMDFVVDAPVEVLASSKALAVWMAAHDEFWNSPSRVHLWDEATVLLVARGSRGADGLLRCSYCGEAVHEDAPSFAARGRGGEHLFCDCDCADLWAPREKNKP